jgi:hypothetical protein
MEIYYHEKPPLGIMPRNVWVAMRVDELWQAIDRYRETEKQVPEEWLEELAYHYRYLRTT